VCVREGLMIELARWFMLSLHWSSLLLDLVEEEPISLVHSTSLCLVLDHYISLHFVNIFYSYFSTIIHVDFVL
jgi:hypothetical protein